MRMILLLIAFLFFSVPALADPDRIPRTGQTTCYDASGSSVTCAGTGQDGETQYGTPWPTIRFTDNSNGTITDNLTGLMWLKDANCASTIGHNPNGGSVGNMSWINALSFVAGINSGTYNISSCSSYSAGHADWHLPNVRELETLFHYGSGGNITWLGTAGFANVRTDNYWSSTTYLDPAIDRAYTAYASGTPITATNKAYSSPDPTYTWPVRRDTNVSPVVFIPKTGQTICYDSSNNSISCSGTGQDAEIQFGTAWPGNRFANHANGTLTDHLTDLMWVMEFPVSGSINWQNALNYVAGMNSGTNTNFGYTDWRLANVRETWSLIDFENYNPALPTGHPFCFTSPCKVAGNSWGSNFSLDANNKASYVSIVNGTVGGTSKSSGISFLAVRGTYPIRILSPVAGPVEEMDNNGGSCPTGATTWCFNQHRSGLHSSGNGVGSSDDTEAWDVNLASDADDGMPVFAVASGIVESTYAGQSNPGAPGSGQLLIRHNTNGQIWWSGYLHMTNISVSIGDPVTVNTQIGEISDVGASSVNHLHFILYKGSNTSGNLISFDAEIMPRQ